MDKTLSCWKSIILIAFLLSFYNSNLLYGEENNSDSKKTLKIKTVEKISGNSSVKIDDDVKRGVIFALSSLADSSDVPFLKGLLKRTERGDYINKAYCAEALVRLGDTSAVDVLLKDLDDKDNSFRLLTAETLGKLKAGDVAADRYMAKLENKDLSEITRAVRILGQLSVDKTLSVIIERTKDRNELIRKEAAFALSDFKNRVALPVLEALLDLLKDDSEEVRIQAVTSLGTLYERITLKDIFLESPVSDETQLTFLLSMENGEKAAVGLKKLLKDSSNKVKSCAIRSLGLLEDRASVLSIAEELHNDDALIRQAAATAIGRIRDSSVASKLVSLFNDPDENVQVEAVKAVGLVGEQSLLKEVLKKSGNRYIDLEVAVLVTAFQLGDSSVVDKCIDGMEKGDIISKIVYAQALGSMVSTEKTIKVLNAALNNEDPLVRIAAVRSLGLLKSDTSLFNIINILGDKNAEVNIEACLALKSLENHEAVAALRKMLE